MKFTSLAHLPEQVSSHNPLVKKKVMISNGELPNLTNFSQAIFAPGESVIPHIHPTMYEIFFVEQGEGIIRINEQDYPLEPGNCIIVEPQELHQLINTGSQDLILTFFGLVSP